MTRVDRRLAAKPGLRKAASDEMSGAGISGHKGKGTGNSHANTGDTSALPTALAGALLQRFAQHAMFGQTVCNGSKGCKSIRRANALLVSYTLSAYLWWTFDPRQLDGLLHRCPGCAQEKLGPQVVPSAQTRFPVLEAAPEALKFRFYRAGGSLAPSYTQNE